MTLKIKHFGNNENMYLWKTTGTKLIEFQHLAGGCLNGYREYSILKIPTTNKSRCGNIINFTKEK